MDNLYKNFSAIPCVSQKPVALRDENKEKQIKTRSIIGAAIGAGATFALSMALFRKNNMPFKDMFVKGDAKKSIKNLYDSTKIDYEGIKGFFAMTLQGSGAALGSLFMASTVDKDEKNKKAKIEEALLMINNVIIPTIFVKTKEVALEKIEQTAKSQNLRKFASNRWTKNIMTALALMSGMMLSLSVTNTINSKFVDPEDKNVKKMKPLDFIYHVDDIIPILACSKTGIFSKIPIDRTLPFIYAYMGSKVGQKTSKEEKTAH